MRHSSHNRGHPSTRFRVATWSHAHKQLNLQLQLQRFTIQTQANVIGYHTPVHTAQSLSTMTREDDQRNEDGLSRSIHYPSSVTDSIPREKLPKDLQKIVDTEDERWAVRATVEKKKRIGASFVPTRTARRAGSSGRKGKTIDK